MNSQGLTKARTKACKCLPGPSKKLIVCIDGTSNQFGLKNTNIVELYSNLDKDTTKQLTYYDSGIGTAARSSWTSPGTALKQWIDTRLDLALALNIEKIILRAYVWLCNHFTEDETGVDKIYLFGFSRGAYQVRALAAMIETASTLGTYIVGLLLPGNEAQVPFAYEIYANLGPRWRSEAEKAKFKATFSRKHARVHFLGIWDTVKAVSVHTNPLPLVVGDYNHVCFVRHALALDERRSLFLHLPIFDTSPHATSLAHDSFPDHIKEVWFAGTHSEVGGGRKANPELDSGNISLSWMRQEAQLAGLLASTPDLRFRLVDLTGLPNKQLKGRWKLLQFLVKRPKRQVRSDQKIHASVLFKNSGYKPEASITPEIEPYPPFMKWDDEKSPSKVAELDSHWEKGIFDSSNARIMMDKLCEGEQPQFIHYIAFLSRSPEGQRSIKDIENSTASLINLLAQSASVSVDIRIGAMVVLVELEEAPDECADYLREFHKVAQSDETGEEFQCRFMDSLHRLVKHATLRDIIRREVIPTIERFLMEEKVTITTRLFNACTRALDAVTPSADEFNRVSQTVPDSASSCSQPSLPVGNMESTEMKRSATSNTGRDEFGSQRVRDDLAKKLVERFLEPNPNNEANIFGTMTRTFGGGATFAHDEYDATPYREVSGMKAARNLIGQNPFESRMRKVDSIRNAGSYRLSRSLLL